MDKNSIKNFAVESRKKLIEDIKYKANLIGITEENINEPIVKSEGIETYSIHESGSYSIYDENIIKREKLIHEIENKGFNNVVEEVAYTWFNRIIAIRFMEVNNYLPTKTRVLSSEVPGKSEPDIITEALDLDLDLTSEDKEKIFNLKDENKLDDLFEFLFIKQCNKLNEILPGLFEKTEDFAELLLNISFVKPDGIIQQLIQSISEEDFHDQVEIIGWLYQYYNTDRKEEVLGFKKSLVKKEDIPAATQLFTTDWIVRYMVDNSLGRYWLERNQDSSLKENLEYYIEDDNPKKVFKPINIDEIKFFDPCMGSGHILVYAFDVFYQVYLELGYSSKQIPELILKNNIYGLDIDDRAYQLSYFALMMKARSYDRTIFSKKIIPNVFSIQECNNITDEIVKNIQDNSKGLYKELNYLIDSFKDAKEFGSLIQLEKIDIDNLEQNLTEFLENNKSNLSNIDFFDNIQKDVYSLLNQTKLLTLSYDIVVTNPPYLNKYDSILKKFIKENYKDYSKDLFSVFIYRNFLFCKENGYSALMTPNVWMFIKSYEKLRQYIFNEKDLISLIQLEDSAFYSEAGISICTFVLSNNYSDLQSTFISLTKFKGDMEIQKQKVLEAISEKTDYTYKIKNSTFNAIPGYPMAYWADKPLFDAFENEPLDTFSDVKKGLFTADNNRFLRLWFEINLNKINFNEYDKNYKWFPLNKGGSFRRWYGNQDYLINWQNNGEEVRNFEKSGVTNISYYFKEFICWTCISMGDVSFRYCPNGFVPDHAAGYIYFRKDKEYLLSFLNSSVSKEILKILAPTINYNVGDIAKVPIIKNNDHDQEIISLLTYRFNLGR